MSHLKRMSPMRVVDDLAEEGLFYEAFGATRISPDSADCAGYKAANDTTVILTSRKFAISSYGPFIAGKLARQGALYFHVDNIDAELADLPGAAHVLSRSVISGVEEAVIETERGLIVLAREVDEVQV
jgi:hypothetical protein